MGEFLKGYKGFEPGLVCKDKQYEEDTVFEEDKAVICNSGMHFCVNPFDVLNYYGLVNEDGVFNEFAPIEALAESKTDDNKKYCTTKLKIGAKLGLKGFIKACVDFTLEKTKFEKSECDESSSGNYAKIGSSGDSAKIGSSGNYAQIGSSGDSAQIGSSGNSAKVNSTGQDAVVMCAGYNSIAKAKKGSWITLAEWKNSGKKGRYVPVCVKTEYVDGKKIKEDTFYKLEDGKFKEI